MRTTVLERLSSTLQAILTTAVPTVISTGWRKRPGMRRSTAMGPLPPPCWPVSIRITTASRPRRRNTPGSTAWNFSTGISGPISGQGISGPENLAFICRSTAGVSFPNRTATRSRSTGTRKNLRSRCTPRTVHMKKTFSDPKPPPMTTAGVCCSTIQISSAGCGAGPGCGRPAG